MDRIEALTNAARHADASSCELRIAVNGMLELEVEDDGWRRDRTPGAWDRDAFDARPRR